MRLKRYSPTKQTPCSQNLCPFARTGMGKNLFTHGSTVLPLDLGRFLGFLNLYTVTQNKRTNTYIHALNGIRTHDPSVRASEDSSCLRPRGHCDQQWELISSNTSFYNKQSFCSGRYSPACVCRLLQGHTGLYV
jgi:hypothetical protein